MPELPEVEITRQKLLPLIRGRRVLDFWTDWPRGLKMTNGKGRMTNNPKRMAADIRGRRVLDVTRRGKVLFFRLSGSSECVLVVHLRMSGRLGIVDTGVPRGDISLRSYKFVTPASDGKWVHFRWQLSGGRELRFIDPRKFGRVWYGSPERVMADPYFASLGVDAKTLSPQAFVAALRGLPGRRGMVKPLLLRQDIVAGIGNILADESLWRARIHPKTSVASLDDGALRRLGEALGRTIRAVLAAGGTSIRTFRHPDGGMGRYQEERLVYGKAGKPCPRCRTKLQRIVVGGRGTTLCPRCQRL